MNIEELKELKEIVKQIWLDNKLLIGGKVYLNEFIKNHEKAINYTRCSLELKGKDTPTFEEFKQENFKEVRSGVYNSYNMKEDLSSNDVLFKYIDFYFNPLIT